MAQIIEQTNFITILDDNGKFWDFDKKLIQFSVSNAGVDLIFRDLIRQGGLILPYTAFTVPTSTDVYDLRNQITAMIT